MAKRNRARPPVVRQTPPPSDFTLPTLRPGRRGGRQPKLQPDADTLRRIEATASVMCTFKEAAAILGVDEKTFTNFRKRHPECLEYWQRGQDGGKASLRRKQFALAERNAVMAIFLGLNYLGQRDRRELVGAGGGAIAVEVTSARERINGRIARIAERRGAVEGPR